MDLNKKVAIVTGGGTGLGRSVSLKLGAAGAIVAVNYSKSAAEAEATCADIVAAGGRAKAYQADVSRAAESEALAEAVLADFGRIDMVVNNAGTTKVVPFADLDGLEEADFDRLFAVNARSNFFLSRAVVPHMRKVGGGHILNTVSIAGIRPSGSSIAYAVSKAAQIHLTKCLAAALAPDIKVNGVAPGLLLTRWADGFTKERISDIVSKAALKKATDVEDCADLYITILRNESMTGQIVTVDAGQTL